MAAPGEAPRDDALWAAQYRYRFERSLTLSVAADAGHAAIWRTLEHPAPGVAGWGLRPVERDLRLVRRSATTPADEAVPYSYWAELEREIDRQVAAFKSQLRAAMEPEDDSDTRVRYAHTLARRPHQVRKLFHLLHPDYHDPETLGQLARKNLGRIAAVIGVDLPPSDIAARRKVARKPL
jgi:hypothetical protein